MGEVERDDNAAILIKDLNTAYVSYLCLPSPILLDGFGSNRPHYRYDRSGMRVLRKPRRI